MERRVACEKAEGRGTGPPWPVIPGGRRFQDPSVACWRPLVLTHDVQCCGARRQQRRQKDVEAERQRLVKEDEAEVDSGKQLRGLACPTCATCARTYHLR